MLYPFHGSAYAVRWGAGCEFWASDLRFLCSPLGIIHTGGLLKAVMTRYRGSYTLTMVIYIVDVEIDEWLRKATARCNNGSVGFALIFRVLLLHNMGPVYT